MPFTHLSCQELKSRLASEANDISLVDIRDKSSFDQGHIEGAQHIDNSNVADFIASTDTKQHIVVYCYHGNSSQGAADYFNQQGYANTYSLDGGFEAWKLS